MVQLAADAVQTLHHRLGAPRQVDDQRASTDSRCRPTEHGPPGKLHAVSPHGFPKAGDQALAHIQGGFPAAASVIQAEFGCIANEVTIRPQDSVVIMTKGHIADYTVLAQALRTPATYIGMIGSRRKIAGTHARLRDDGFTDADIARIHNPIGLAIKAETPEEIAVSIAAKMILHRASHRKELS